MNITGSVIFSGGLTHIPPPQPPSEPNISSVTYSTVNTANANISVNVALTLRSDGGATVSQYTVTSIPGNVSNTSTNYTQNKH